MTLYARIALAAVGDHGAIQHPSELASFLQWAAWKLGPVRTVVEIGSDAGGTLFAWHECWPDAALFGVSLSHGVYGTHRILTTHGATILDRDSHDAGTLEALRRLLDGAPVDLLFIDGDHSREGAALDVEMYAPLVRPRGIVALHDIADATGQLGVPAAWADLLDRPEFEFGRAFVSDGTWGGIGAALRAE